MGAVGKGRWSVDKDELCLTDAGAKRRCYQVWVSGKDVQLRREGILPEDGVLQEETGEARGSLNGDFNEGRKRRKG